jgi:chemotaxis protein methyltransferase CheR
MTEHPWTDAGLEAVARLLSERTGLVFPPPRHDSAVAGIRRVMARAGLSDLARYCERLRSDPAALDDLIAELTVGETYFFREPGHFDFLQEALAQLRTCRPPDHVLRAWSAGCASGEEAYSLAILFEEEGVGERAHILGTDISRTALARARQAVYSSWSLRGAGAARASRYLHPRGGGLVLDDRFRYRVTFEYLNLALDVYPSLATGTWGMDLILCRNVLIYLDPDTVRRIGRRLFEALAPGGWLLTASSDPPLNGAAPFETVLAEAGVFYRRPLGARSSEDSVLGPGYSVLSTQYPARPGTAPGVAAPDRGFADSAPATRAAPLVESPASHGPEVDPLLAAREALARGDYTHAVELTRGLLANPAAAALHVRALANLDPGQAARACTEAAARHTLATELHYLHAVLLLDLGRDEEAARAARRALYLDRSLAIAHFALGSILWRRGDLEGARRAYRNARDLCAARPAEELAPLAEGERAGRLAEAAAAQLAILDAAHEAAP